MAERAVQELEQELLKIQPEKGPVSQVTLALATSALNSRIRRGGLSSRELWTQRDQFTGNQFPVEDEILIQNQFEARKKNHQPSARSKWRSSSSGPSTGVSVGALVYLVSERSKLQARDKYLVTSVSGDQCTLRKFTRQQFRNKEYQVPLHAVYPIVKHSVNPLPPSCIESSSDSDDDDIVAASEELGEVVDGNKEEEESEDDEEPLPGVCTRPRRANNPPPWHADYEMGI